MRVEPIPSKDAARLVIEHHYLHRRPSISFAYGLFDEDNLVGVVTFGTPASRAIQVSACKSSPNLVVELNRLWVSDSQPKNTESWFLARSINLMPARIVVSYADTSVGHQGYVYRAANFHYAGWTDMDRKTPRFDYVPAAGGHSRSAFRGVPNWVDRVRREPKVKYWTVSGSQTERRHLRRLCQWLDLDWKAIPPPQRAAK